MNPTPDPMATATTKSTRPRKGATPSNEKNKFVRRRRAALMEAGIEHEVAASTIEKRFGIPTTRQAVTNTINGHFESGGGRIEAALVQLIRDTLKGQGETVRANQITPEYLGWSAVISGAT